MTHESCSQLRQIDKTSGLVFPHNSSCYRSLACSRQKEKCDIISCLVTEFNVSVCVTLREVNLSKPRVLIVTLSTKGQPKCLTFSRWCVHCTHMQVAEVESSSSIRAMACFATYSVDTEETGRCFRRMYIVLDSFVCLPLCLSLICAIGVI